MYVIYVYAIKLKNSIGAFSECLKFFLTKSHVSILHGDECRTIHQIYILLCAHIPRIFIFFERYSCSFTVRFSFLPSLSPLFTSSCRLNSILNGRKLRIAKKNGSNRRNGGTRREEGRTIQQRYPSFSRKPHSQQTRDGCCRKESR